MLALSLLMGNKLGKNATISRFLKGVAVQKPQRPRYSSTWDPEPVLNHFSRLYPNESPPFDRLTKKLVILLALITAQRVQTLSKITLDNVHTMENLIQIKISERIKTTGRNKNQPVLNIPFFKEKPELCVASLLQEYIRRTTDLREKDSSKHRLLLTYKKPHHEATSQSISRWIKDSLEEWHQHNHLQSSQHETCVHIGSSSRWNKYRGH